VMLLLGIVERDLCLAVLIGGIPVALVGFLDDRASLSVSARFSVHFLAAVFGVYMLGGVPPIQLYGQPLDVGIAADALAVVAIVWTLNLFNFMDGIDGIACSEAIFVAAAGTVVCSSGVSFVDSNAVALLLVGACLGFLVWNWPPAKIFMGDVGSGYLGYVIALLALTSARENSAGPFIWLILGGVFFVDATVTFVRRLIRRERVYEPHRSHAYQWLARRWGSHIRVTSAVWLVNLFWLLPLALLCENNRQYAGLITLLALCPLVALALAAGAGRSETAK